VSDPDALIEALRAAEAKERQRVRMPAVELTHRLLRRRRRNRVVLACLLALAIAVLSVTALGALPDNRQPPVNPVTPSADPTPAPSISPSPESVAEASTAPAENCLTEGLGYYEYPSDYMFSYATMQGEGGSIPKLCVGTRIKVTWVIYSIDASWTATKVNSGYKYLDRDHPRQQITAPAASGCAMTIWLSYEYPIPTTFKITNPSLPELALARPGPFYDPKHGRGVVDHHELHGFPCPYPSPSPG
jgi:hypothetical protein